MKANTRWVLFVLMLFVGSASANVNPETEITSISSAINKAGRQRMLTQRMLKLYTMIGINVQLESSLKKLDETIRLYDRQLAELKKISPNTKTTQSLDRVEKLWRPYRDVLKKPVSRNNARWLLVNNDALLLSSHQVVLSLQDASGTNIGKLVNISGRQRMLSQRLAKLYMLKAWGFDNSELRSQSEQAKSEFSNGLTELLGARENNSEIITALNAAKEQWELFVFGLERNSEKLVPLIVAMTSEKLLIQMNEITGLYEKLPHK